MRETSGRALNQRILLCLANSSSERICKFSRNPVSTARVIMPLALTRIHRVFVVPLEILNNQLIFRSESLWEKSLFLAHQEPSDSNRLMISLSHHMRCACALYILGLAQGLN